MPYLVISTNCRLSCKTYERAYEFAEAEVRKGYWCTIKRKTDTGWINVIEMFP